MLVEKTQTLGHLETVELAWRRLEPFGQPRSEVEHFGHTWLEVEHFDRGWLRLESEHLGQALQRLDRLDVVNSTCAEGKARQPAPSEVVADNLVPIEDR